MIADAAPSQPTDKDPVTTFAAAAYLQQITEEMAIIARRAKLFRVAAALSLARDLAEDALERLSAEAQSDLGKPAPEEAA